MKDTSGISITRTRVDLGGDLEGGDCDQLNSYLLSLFFNCTCTFLFLSLPLYNEIAQNSLSTIRLFNKAWQKLGLLEISACHLSLGFLAFHPCQDSGSEGCLCGVISYFHFLYSSCPCHFFPSVRYPTFADALRDLDDPLTLCNTFSILRRKSGIKFELVPLCKRLVLEFMNYVIASRSLRKVRITLGALLVILVEKSFQSLQLLCSDNMYAFNGKNT